MWLFVKTDFLLQSQVMLENMIVKFCLCSFSAKRVFGVSLSFFDIFQFNIISK